MWQFDESAAQFPAPRSEEPANLRREIVDELADHLTCALRREQLAGGPQSQTTAEERVRDRFGDPVKVARKLWFDWMWEKIMTQRILVGACVLMAVMSCVALGLAWTSLNRQQDLIATWQSTSQSQMQEQQKLFERLLAQSEKSMASASAKAPSDWNPVEFRFVSGNEDGPPVAGISVDLSIEAKETGIPRMEGTSNEQGIVAFERVRYGSYTLLVKNPTKESYTTGFTLQPGQSLTRTIVCPVEVSEPAKVIPRIAWPEDLADKPLWFRFDQSGVYRPVANKKWYPPVPAMHSSTGAKQPLIAPNADLAEASWRGFFESQRSPRTSRNDRQEVSPLWTRNAVGPLIAITNPNRDPDVRKKDWIEWPGDAYRIPRLEVMMSEDGFTSLGEFINHFTAAAEERSRRTGPSRPSPRPYFDVIPLNSDDWSYRVERRTGDEPGRLWLTPTAQSLEIVRKALMEIEEARQQREKARAETRAEYEKRRAAAEQEATAKSGSQKESPSESATPKRDEADKKQPDETK